MLCYNVESKMLTKLIEVVVKEGLLFKSSNSSLFFYLIAKYLVILWNVSVIVVFVISFVYRHYRHFFCSSYHFRDMRESSILILVGFFF
jgi:hypothetical protein